MSRLTQPFYLSFFLITAGTAAYLSAEDIKPVTQTVRRSNVIEVTGFTQCIPSNKAIIAPAVLHPVVEVLVKPGDRVKKDQPLVKLDDDEPQADVRNKQAILENARVSLKENRRYLAKIELPLHMGVVSEQKLHDLRAQTLKNEMDERAAVAALDGAKAELEHYVVTAPIDGVINKLDVHLGMVSRPGTTIWGEILNLKELDVRCLVSSEQADQIEVGQKVEIRRQGTLLTPGEVILGKVTFIAFAAEKEGGPIPVLIRFTNPQEKLRCGIAVQVRILTGAGIKG
ncbi:MAG TPA: efflux RND transporter periplasmic adaptor subunit [Gemmatales bacterium]|nr:efflux RND transporter periplasmic adaptor subunit [Gemmatales bacterium]